MVSTRREGLAGKLLKNNHVVGNILEQPCHISILHGWIHCLKSEMHILKSLGKVLRPGSGMTNMGAIKDRKTGRFGSILPTVLFAVSDRVLCISFAVFCDCGIFTA